MFCQNCGSSIADQAVVCPHCGVRTETLKTTTAPAIKYCYNCGSQIAREAVICVHCGVSVVTPQQDPLTRAFLPDQGRSWLVSLLLCGFLGVLGVHRFYTGHILTGIVQFLTCGGCGIWWILDLIWIATGAFRDSDDLPLVK